MDEHFQYLYFGFQTNILTVVTNLKTCRRTCLVSTYSTEIRFVLLQRLQTRSTTCSMVTQVARSSRRPTIRWWIWDLPPYTVCSTTTTSVMRASESSPGDARMNWGLGIYTLSLFLSLFVQEYQGILFRKAQLLPNQLSSSVTIHPHLGGETCVRCVSNTDWFIIDSKYRVWL